MEKALIFKAVVPANIEKVWKAWTTKEGAVAFFAPACKIDLKPGGAYEMYFDLEADQGSQGGEGCIILALDPLRMLSLTWNAPPEIPDIRVQRTHVTIYFETISSNETMITLRHDGWGTSSHWLAARQYFKRAWGKVVIPRLIQSFTTGPIQWNHF